MAVGAVDAQLGGRQSVALGEGDELVVLRVGLHRHVGQVARVDRVLVVGRDAAGPVLERMHGVEQPVVPVRGGEAGPVGVVDRLDLGGRGHLGDSRDVHRPRRIGFADVGQFVLDRGRRGAGSASVRVRRGARRAVAAVSVLVRRWAGPVRPRVERGRSRGVAVQQIDVVHLFEGRPEPGPTGRRGELHDVESHESDRHGAAGRIDRRDVAGVVDLLGDEAFALDLLRRELLPRGLEFDRALSGVVGQVDRRREVLGRTGGGERLERTARLKRGVLVRGVVVAGLREVLEFGPVDEDLEEYIRPLLIEEGRIAERLVELVQEIRIGVLGERSEQRKGRSTIRWRVGRGREGRLRPGSGRGPAWKKQLRLLHPLEEHRSSVGRIAERRIHIRFTGGAADELRPAERDESLPAKGRPSGFRTLVDGIGGIDPGAGRGVARRRLVRGGRRNPWPQQDGHRGGDPSRSHLHLCSSTGCGRWNPGSYVVPGVPINEKADPMIMRPAFIRGLNADPVRLCRTGSGWVSVAVCGGSHPRRRGWRGSRCPGRRSCSPEP